jgi:hypothetical protein
MKKYYLSLIVFFLFIQINNAQSLFCEDFENGPNGWYILTTSGNIDWQQDTFSIGSSPNHIWDIGLDSGYGANEKATLFSPVYNVASPFNLSVCFWLQYNACYYDDGMRVDFSVDGGTSWSVLGNGGLTNWYDTYFITSSGGLPGWSLQSPIWIQAFYNYGTIFGLSTIQFHFVFTSVVNTVCANSGFFLIDNFCLCNGINCNCISALGLEELDNASKTIISPNPASTEFQISNFNFQTNDEILLRDVLGKIYFTKEIKSPTSDFSLQTSDFTNGIYFLEIKTKNGLLNNKVVVQH